jgi:hypothetical protein
VGGHQGRHSLNPDIHRGVICWRLSAGHTADASQPTAPWLRLCLIGSVGVPAVWVAPGICPAGVLQHHMHTVNANDGAAWCLHGYQGFCAQAHLGQWRPNWLLVQVRFSSCDLGLGLREYSRQGVLVLA